MSGKMKMLSVMLLAAMTAACSGQGTTGNSGAKASDDLQAKPPEVTKEPVELTFYYMYADSNYDEFMKEQGSQIQKKYPNFKFKFVQNTKGTTPEDIVASKMDVDVFIAINSSMMTIKDLKLDSDISDLVTKHKFDLNRLDPTALSVLRGIGDGKLPGLPFKTNALGLFYNKDLFDKFGVPYPKDGWTWDDAYETAKKLTRNEGGVQYRGFGIRPLGNTMLLNQHSINMIQKDTFKATINNDQWKQYLSKLIPMFQIPGYDPTAANMADAKQADMFFKEQTTAMLVSMNSDFPKAHQNLNINWDAATFPVFKEKPGVGSGPDIVYYALSATSKHRDEAFLAMAEMLSDDVQMARSKIGNPTVLKSQSIRDAFGTENPDLKGKNVKALIPPKYAEPTVYTKHNTKVVVPLVGAYRSVILGQKDLNTALREAEEKANKDIEAAIGAAAQK
ncbi:extracellular solute-binding protein [Paenibacillus mesophilus]|uniref:ABC transporter substrate-binding protein n=1 Tax=Paenibacillus mesophilus TaxID=2582849 RepID=UPI00110F0597|nr:extracellular solute-binding protein [Paenibacillus mesophilus]TMV47594.1 extracellular solute-binding protein [Paenibacillus mesophilus]